MGGLFENPHKNRFFLIHPLKKMPRHILRLDFIIQTRQLTKKLIAKVYKRIKKKSFFLLRQRGGFGIYLIIADTHKREKRRKLIKKKRRLQRCFELYLTFAAPALLLALMQKCLR